MTSLLALLLSLRFLAPSERIPTEEAARRVEAIVAESKQLDGPGVVAGVIRDGTVAYRGAVGVTKASGGTPLGPRTPFYIASVSKQFTAACMHQLAATGRVTLDDDVRKHMPELSATPKRVTIRHLLNHRSGIRDYFELLTLRGDDLDALADPKPILDLLARQKELCFEPGRRFLYSNSGYLMLGEIVRRVSGKPLSAYAAENLFGPLGMKDSRFRDSAATSIPGLALGHELVDGHFTPRETRFAIVGSGGVVTTLEDLILWDRNFDVKKVGATFLDALQTPPPLDAGDVVDPAIGPYGSGLFLGRYRGHRAVRHAGGSFGYKAEFLRLPDERLTVIVLANASVVDATGLAEKIADVYLEPAVKEPASAGTPPIGDFRPLLGPYFDPATHRVWILTPKDDHVKAICLGTPPIRLRPAGPRLLCSVATPVVTEFRFEDAGEGQASRLAVTVDGRADGSFEARKIGPLPAEELAAAAGTYRCDEIDATIVFEAANGRLAWASPKPSLPIPPFVSIGKDVLLSDVGAQLELDRDAQGRVTGARLSTNRAWNLRLVKR